MKWANAIKKIVPIRPGYEGSLVENGYTYMSGWVSLLFTLNYNNILNLTIVVQSLSCVWLWNSMDCNTPGFPVLHYLLEFAQTYVHWVSDIIQPSHPVIPVSSCPHSCPAFGSFPVNQLFISDGQCFGASASVLPMNIRGWFPLGLTGLISLLSKEFSRVFKKHQSLQKVQKHPFFDYTDLCWQSTISAL